MARELIVDFPDGDMGVMPMHNLVPRLDGTPGAIHRAAPRLREHNRELPAGIGMASQETDKLISKGVLCGEARRSGVPGEEQ